MNKSSLGEEWVKNPDGTPGCTWNPITGCLKGCEYCYARKLANTRLRARYLANTHTAAIRFETCSEYRLKQQDPFYPRFWPDKLHQVYARKWRKPKGIFTCDMSDLFGIGVPANWTNDVLKCIKGCDQHRFYLLTKQPQNLIMFSPFPDNAWVGVTATDRRMWYQAVWELEKVIAKVKYISLEPLLDWKYDMQLDPHFPDRIRFFAERCNRAGIKWVIIGAQTKPTVMPKIEWVREIVEACDKVGIPVFLKKNLERLIRKEVPLFQIDTSGFLKDGDLRQEIPEG